MTSRTRQAAGFAIRQGVKKAASAIGSRIAKTAVGSAIKGAFSAATGAATGGVSLAAQAAIEAIKNADKIAQGAVGLVAAAAGGLISVATSAFWPTFGIAILAVPAIATLFLVIINTGAYIVPPGDLVGVIGQPSVDPGLDIDSTCPIPDGIVSTPSFESLTSGHGSNRYWNAVPNPACDFRIPAYDANCSDTPVSGSVCYNATSSCPWYGFAADVVYPSQGSYSPTESLAVYLPYIEGNTVTWRTGSYRGFESSYGGYGSLITNTSAGLFEMVFLHISAPPIAGNSGDVTASLYNGLGSNRHLHIELKVDGEFVKPDFLCR